jgi:hypothetical protein
MDNPLFALSFIPGSIAVSLILVSLYLLVSRHRVAQTCHKPEEMYQTPLQQFNSWPGGRTKVTIEGSRMVRTRVKTDPVSGISFQVREEA